MDPHLPHRTEAVVAARTPCHAIALGLDVQRVAIVGPGDDAAGFVAAAHAELDRGATVAVVTFGPSTDAIKRVTADGTVVATVDREALVRVGPPALIARAAFEVALAAAEPGTTAADLVTAVTAAHPNAVLALPE